jgi:hypothetical protein
VYYGNFIFDLRIFNLRLLFQEHCQGVKEGPGENVIRGAAVFPAFGTRYSIEMITNLAYTLIFMELRSIVFVADTVTGLLN